MNLVIWCMLLFLCENSKEMVLDHSVAARWRLYGIGKGHHFIPNHKRHSDGTYTNDFANNQDTIRAKDFVKWLTNIKRERFHEDLHEFAGV